MNSFDHRMASLEDKHISKHFAGIIQVWESGGEGGSCILLTKTAAAKSIVYIHTTQKVKLRYHGRHRASPDGVRLLAVRRSVKRTAPMMALTQFEEVTRAST